MEFKPVTNNHEPSYQATRLGRDEKAETRFNLLTTCTENIEFLHHKGARRIFT